MTLIIVQHNNLPERIQTKCIRELFLSFRIPRRTYRAFLRFSYTILWFHNNLNFCERIKRHLNNRKKPSFLPVKCDLVTVSALHVFIQQIEAYVRGRAFHPFYENIALAQVKVVRIELIFQRRCFPIKFFCNFAPEFRRIIHRSEKQTVVKFENNFFDTDEEMSRRSIDRSYCIFVWQFAWCVIRRKTIWLIPLW